MYMSIEESFEPLAFFAGRKFEQPISRIAVGSLKPAGAITPAASSSASARSRLTVIVIAVLFRMVFGHGAWVLPCKLHSDEDVAAALQASDDHTGERCATGAPAPLKAAEFA